MSSRVPFPADPDAVPLSRVREAFDMLRADRENSYKTGQWCGVVRWVMTGRMLEAGLPVRALGTAMIVAPAGCPDEALLGAGRGPDPRDTFSFARALNRLAPGRDFIEYKGYIFQQEEGPRGRPRVIIRNADGSPVEVPVKGWRATLGDDGGEAGGGYTDHVTLAMKARMPDGGVENLVVDPSLFEDGPVSFAAWHAKQGCPPAIAVHGDHEGIVRPVPTTAESRARLAGILSCKAEDAAIGAAVEERVRNKPKAYAEMVCDIMATLGAHHAWAENPYLKLPYVGADGRIHPDADVHRRSLERDRRLMAPYAAFEEWQEANRQAGLVSPSPAPRSLNLPF